MFLLIDIEGAELHELYDYWRRKYRGDRLPARADIDPIEITGFLKSVAILQVRDESEDFVFVLAGNHIEEVHGRALKGVSLRQIQDEFEVSPSIRPYLDAVNSREPQFQQASLKDFGKEQWTCQRLILPLSSDGERVDFLLMGALFNSATGSLPPGKLAEQHVEILEVPSPIAVADEERSHATAKKWSVRKSILFVFVMSVVLWALIILGVRQIF